MKYIVYEHKFKTSGKSYIGYTSLSIEKRLHKHFVNAISGIETKFYRAIRKYGMEDIESLILFESVNVEEAKNWEKFLIKEKDTFKTGYNMTLGGDGGNCTLKMSALQKRIYFENRKIAAKGDKNPNHSGLTDDEIIEKAVQYFIENKKLTRNRWTEYCKKEGYPVNYSKCRFDGFGYNGFVKKLKEELVKLNIKFTDSQFIVTKEERYKDLKLKITDEEIIEKAVNFYLKNGSFCRKKWIEFNKSNNIPFIFVETKNIYSNSRFSGLGHQEFIRRLKERLLLMNIQFKMEYKC